MITTADPERRAQGLPGPLIAIAGPTASGKSALAIRLALKYGGEIVGCDSMQIYREMDIGTAKPTAEEMAAVPHHLVGFADPSVPYSCADYVADADRAVTDILGRGRLPVVCGGTGLYLETLLYSRPFSESGGRTDIRDRLTAEAEAEGGKHALWERLKQIDPASAEAVHENNVRRVIRALELYCTTGKTKTELEKNSGEPRYDALCIALHTPDRCIQNARIEKRAAAMLRSGLIEETRRLRDAGIFEKNTTAAQAIGYKEILGYLDGTETPARAEERLCIATRQYAKRQDTWFGGRRYMNIIDITAENPDPFEAACGRIDMFLESRKAGC